MRPEHNFTKLANEWPLPGLSAVDRKRIESELFMADAVFHTEDADMETSIYAYFKPMAQAFTKVAEVLFDANLLTVQLLENELRLFIVEAAVAGKWFQRFRSTDSDRIEIFPGYLGHSSAWEYVNDSHRAYFERLVFSVGIAEWTGKLLEREAASMRAPATQPKREAQLITQPEANKRRAFVMPLLDDKGWSILDWAIEAEVSHATAMDYLDEKTKPFRSTRLKLAKALGIKVEQLPK